METEKQLLIPMPDGVHRNIGAIGAGREVLWRSVAVVDNGFHREESARMVLEPGIGAYLPGSHFRKRDPAFAM